MPYITHKPPKDNSSREFTVGIDSVASASSLMIQTDPNLQIRLALPLLV